jgi:protein-L-isoaspartate(D-aspartate) O-methyltransferase
MRGDRISHRVRQVVTSLPRARFVPEDYRHEADGDYPIPIGYGQTISQPTIVAIMTTALELDGDERVLEIGTGSGFQTAVLAELAAQVYTVEIVESLSLGAQEVLAELDLDNVHYRIGDGYDGWPEAAPFDRIICTAAPPRLPQSLIAQLALDGIFVAPIGRFFQELYQIRRGPRGLEERRICGVRFVPMVRGSMPD